MDRYLCIHGHFYQPPRENPWLEAVELQDSAFPYHDWNERITDECYRQNAHSRILDDDKYIAKIVNNYSRISFNFGPTLLSWFEEHTPDVYAAILEADRLSAERFSGHGSALAQAYNHMILPLANERDRNTQIKWGIRDFESRFGRQPEGMWLPETAVDTPTLESLVDQGIQFTILAPHQGARVSSKRGGKTKDLNGDVDPSRAYEVRLPSGRSIAVFFYDGPISQAVAFEGLLNSGAAFMDRLLSGFSEERDWPQLAHIATDGETYGHHHRFGDMALAWALDRIEASNQVTLTNYGEYLEMHPPQHIAEIVENSSWSCAHGIERWRSDCGCTTGGHAGWTQQWRKPLREALDWLRDAVEKPYENEIQKYLREAWTARDDYIDVMLNRSSDKIEGFLTQHSRQTLSDADRSRVLRLLELQRHVMLMYTSCGWFFDELSRIETVQVIRYAGRAIQLAEQLFDRGYEDGFLSRLEQAESNVPEHGNGRHIYERFIKPAVINLRKVGAHYAISSLFEHYGDHDQIYCYDVTASETTSLSAGKARLNIGRATMTSHITLEHADLIFAAIHLGDHIMNGAVRDYEGSDEFRSLIDEATTVFNRADFTGVFRLLDSRFGDAHFTLGSLFRDEQRRVMDQVLESSLNDVEAIYRNIYHDYAPMMRFLAEHDLPVPEAMIMPARFIINARFRRLLSTDPTDTEGLRQLLDEANNASIELDHVVLSFSAEHALHRCADKLDRDSHNVSLLAQIGDLVEFLRMLPFSVDRATLQNKVYEHAHTVRPSMIDSAKRGSDMSKQWIEMFDRLADLLGLRIK